MDVTTPNSHRSPASGHGPDGESDSKRHDQSKTSSPQEQPTISNPVPTMVVPPPAAAAIHQPKIVQTAFIHKLYKLEPTLFLLLKLNIDYLANFPIQYA